MSDLARRPAWSVKPVQLNRAVALSLTVLVAGCGAPVPPTPTPAPVETPLADGMTRVVATSQAVPPGTSQPLSLYTHCGLEQAVIDFAGSLWDPVLPVEPSPAADDETDGGVPSMAIEDPFDEGMITLTDGDSAVFVAASGVRIDLVPHPGPKDVMVCY